MTHPRVRKEFEDNKVPIPLNANDINETEFFQQTLPDTRKVAVDHIVRVVRGEKEYLLSYETMTGQTLEGNNRYLSKTFGKFSFPYFVKTYSPTTGRNEANGKVDRWEERYDIPSSPEAIKKLFKKDQVGSNTAMTIDLGAGMQFTVTNKKDFAELPADKLVAKVTGKDINTIRGAPAEFVTRSQEDGSEGSPGSYNSQQEQDEARRRMYDFSSLATNSSSTFGPTEEQKALAQPTLAPQPVLNVVPSTATPSSLPPSEQQGEQAQIEQKEGDKPQEPKRAVGQSRAREKISEDVGVILKNEDTGVRQNMTKDSITIEEPQGQAAKKQRDQDEQEEEESTRRGKR